jgi:hypothetical protein
MKYFMRGYYDDGQEILSSGHCAFGEYANDRNAVRFMQHKAKNILNARDKKVSFVRLSRYTNFYDDATFTAVYTWNKELTNA